MTPDIDSAASITQQAFSKDCSACEETLHMWTEAYGSEAGNMALRALPFGGVYVGGGIALKILAKLKDGTFVRAFCNKTKLADELARIPIFVVLNQDAPVLGRRLRRQLAVSRSIVRDLLCFPACLIILLPAHRPDYAGLLP